VLLFINYIIDKIHVVFVKPVERINFSKKNTIVNFNGDMINTMNSFSMHAVRKVNCFEFPCCVVSSFFLQRLFKMFKGFLKLFLQFYLNKLWIKIHSFFTGELFAILFFIQQAKQRWCQLHPDWLKTAHHCPSRSLIGLHQNCTINS